MAKRIHCLYLVLLFAGGIDFVASFSNIKSLALKERTPWHRQTPDSVIRDGFRIRDEVVFPVATATAYQPTVKLHAASVAFVSTILGTVDTFYRTMPLTSAFLTCGIKASAADLVAQKTHSGKEIEAAEAERIRIEKRRNFAFFCYGGLYQGMAQQLIFNNLFPKVFGQGTDALTVALKVLFDSFVISPLVCLPVAYLVKSMIFNYSFAEAILRYKNDVLEHGLLKKYWSLWMPVQCLTFGVVKPHLRIAFIAMVSFFWLVIFSSITARGSEKTDEMDDSCSLEDGMTCQIDG